MRQGYKVVRLYSGILYSCIVNINEGGVIYTPEVWVHPVVNSGPLCVFNNLEQSRIFHRSNLYCWQIYTCEYTLSAIEHVWMKDDNRKKTSKYDLLRSEELRYSTDFADGVKLLRKVI